MPALARFGLEDKVVIVTGAGRGIGRTIALECFQSGAKLAVGSRTTTELKSLAEEIEAAGGSCIYHPLDVTKVDSIQNQSMRQTCRVVSKRLHYEELCPAYTIRAL